MGRSASSALQQKPHTIEQIIVKCNFRKFRAVFRKNLIAAGRNLYLKRLKILPHAPQTHPSSAIIEDLTPNKTQRIQTSNNKSRISRNTSPQIHRINPIDGNRLKQNVGRWAYAQSTYKIPDLTTKKATDFSDPGTRRNCTFLQKQAKICNENQNIKNEKIGHICVINKYIPKKRKSKLNYVKALLLVETAIAPALSAASTSSRVSISPPAIRFFPSDENAAISL